MAEFASKGVAGSALGLAIGGLSAALLNNDGDGPLGGLLGNGGSKKNEKIADLLGHLGNAWNESGILGILNPASWLPGPCRGLTASDGGSVRAVRCRKNRWWIRIQG